MALEDSYTGYGVIPINTVLLGPVDADGMRGLALHIKSLGTSGSCIVQTSMDGIVWVNVHVQAVSGGASVTAPTGPGMFWCNLVGRYFRVILGIGTTAGTTSILTRLSKEEFSEMGNGIAAAVTSLPAIPAGTNLIGSVQANMSATVGYGVNWSIHRLLTSAATTNATVVKASGGRVGKIYGSHCAATGRCLKLYNKATAPTVGTDVPVLTFYIRASTEFNFDVADLGVFFSNGIAYAFTAGAGDADTAPIAANDIQCLNILYI